MSIFPLYENSFRDSTYTLDNFYTVTETAKQKLLNSIYAEVECVIIVSEVGMGGTHLLAGIYKELKDNAISINYETLTRNYKGDKLLQLKLNEYKYIFLDDFHALYYNPRNELIVELVDQFYCKGRQSVFKSKRIANI